jgi:hypothetical protein
LKTGRARLLKFDMYMDKNAIYLLA